MYVMFIENHIIMCTPHRGKISHRFLKHDLTFKPFSFPTLNSIPLPGQLVLISCIRFHLPGMEQS